MAVKNKKDVDFTIEIGAPEPKHWTEKDLAELKAQAKENAGKRTTDQILKNELMALRYEMEDYIAGNDVTDKTMTLDNVVSAYLAILNLSFRRFAICLGTTDGNLKKYLSGERKFNKDLAMRFGNFFHTSPEIWLYLQLKNELSELKKEKRKIKQYEKYDYRKALKIA
ncbi:MAG: transcriptional regulator [Bacteroidota bacterium]